MTVKYDRIGDTYDLTRRPDPRIADRLVALLGAAPGACALDVACGTGNYTSALAARGLAMVGLDVSRTMLARAGAKHPFLPLVRGDAAALPFADGAFSHAVTTLAIHHMADLPAVFSNVRRVVARGGRYLIFSALPEQVETYWLTSYFPALMKSAVRVCPARKTVEAALAAAGFRSVAIERWDVPPDLEDKFLYAGKDRPELYFDPGFRSGISAFREFAGAEVAHGLDRLRADLDSGRWRTVRAGAEHGNGDYCFFIAE